MKITMLATTLGIAFLVVAALLLTSPYWLYRELTDTNDEPLPEWMGERKARKKRLAVAAGMLLLVSGGIIMLAQLS
ncbi:MAG: hypothetical protein LC104_08700 [Bacteroidales bacterium]|nr:hypothetical protein [Bacteroidales bacterium]